MRRRNARARCRATKKVRRALETSRTQRSADGGLAEADTAAATPTKVRIKGSHLLNSKKGESHPETGTYFFSSLCLCAQAQKAHQFPGRTEARVFSSSQTADTTNENASSIPSKRKRSPSLSSDEDWSEDSTPPVTSKSRAKASKKRETKQAATVDEYTAGKAKSKPLAGPKQWRKDWKGWINDPENQSSALFERDYEEVLINVKESGKVYGVKGEELACLPHCPVTNPHGKGFTPMKFFKKAEVIRLAFRKEAVLAGVSQDDEDQLLATGQELYEEKHG